MGDIASSTAKTLVSSLCMVLQALGKIMGAELPKVPGGNNVVLYPSSARAGKDLQNSLIESGFTVNRVHTYDTVRNITYLWGCIWLMCPWDPISMWQIKISGFTQC